MYSYENKAAVFSEDTIKRMTFKLKTLRNANKDSIYPENEARLLSFLDTLNTLESSHADFYA